MTALAMIIGMAPMALGLGEGGEQNAPLGRAVIGGLVFATVATLIFWFRRSSACCTGAGAARETCRSNRGVSCRLIIASLCRVPALAAHVAACCGYCRRCHRVTRHHDAAIDRCAAARADRSRRRCRSVAVKTPDLQTTPDIDLPGRLEALCKPSSMHAQRLYQGVERRHRRPVTAGQVLAEIEAPDLDQQIMQAEADVASAKANAGIIRGDPEAGPNA